MLQAAEPRTVQDTLPGILERAARGGAGYSVHRDDAEEPRRLPFRELHRRASAVAAALQARGVAPGDRVCLLSPTTPELLVAIWGVWAAGAAVVVLAPPTRSSMVEDASVEIAQRYRQADARLLLHAGAECGEAAARLAAVDGGPILTARIETCDGDDPGPPSIGPVDPDDLAILQFTSGTTARSRAVALTHRQVLTNLTAFSDALGLSAEDRGVSWLPLHHDMGMIVSITAVAHAGEMLVMPTESFIRRPGSWLEAIASFRGTVTASPNLGYRLAAADLRRRRVDLDLSCLRVLGNGAEPIDAAVLDRFRRRAARFGVADGTICPMYGLAEAVVAVSVARPGRPVRDIWVDRPALEQERVARAAEPGSARSRRLVACGPPVPGTELDIRDDAGDPLPPGRVGEIWVRPAGGVSHYFRDPEATAAIVRDGWFATGDLGFLQDGELVVCGRIKAMIIVGGRNLYPEDYEQLAAGLDGVRQSSVAAFGLPDKERMVVVAESRRRGEHAEQLALALLALLAETLSHAPEEVVVVRPGSLPKTTSGKVQRELCRTRHEAGELDVVTTVGRR